MCEEATTPKLTIPLVQGMIKDAVYESEMKVLARVKDVILANNEKITEQLQEAGVFNQE